MIHENLNQPQSTQSFTKGIPCGQDFLRVP
jgi:hypothetical protein